MSRLIGLGLTLIKNDDLEDKSLHEQFIVQDFLYKEDIKNDLEEFIYKDSKKLEDNTVSNLMDSLDKLSQGNKKIKEKAESKIKSEEKKKETKNNKLFKVDKSFLKED